MHQMLATVALTLAYEIDYLDKDFVLLSRLQSPVTFGQFKFYVLSLLGIKLMELTMEEVLVIFRNTCRQILVKEMKTTSNLNNVSKIGD
jgi:hypothetical protein